MLQKHYGIPAIIIIDEYDTPIQQGHSCNFYDEIVGFMRNFFSGGLKDNPNLAYGFLTGILRVAKESIFSGLNNLKTNSILDDSFSEYFGFTPDEVKGLLQYYGKADKFQEVCDCMTDTDSEILIFSIPGQSSTTFQTTAFRKPSGSPPAATTLSGKSFPPQHRKSQRGCTNCCVEKKSPPMWIPASFTRRCRAIHSVSIVSC